MVQAALDQTASGRRRSVTGPGVLADRGSDDAEMARRAAADVAAHEAWRCVSSPPGRFQRWGGSHRRPASWMSPACTRTQPAQRRKVSGITWARWGCESAQAMSPRAAHHSRRADRRHSRRVTRGHRQRAGRGCANHLMGLLPEAFVRGMQRPVLVVRGSLRTGLRGRSSSWMPADLTIRLSPTREQARPPCSRSPPLWCA